MGEASSFYAIRFLPPKTTGLGTIVKAFATDADDLSLEECRERWPDIFADSGFYTLMKGTGLTLIVEKEQPK